MEKYQMTDSAGERLYNSIVLPEQWPPADMGGDGDEPQPVPYLDAVPDPIDIRIGRQLFVDDFLIETSDMMREYHQAEKYLGNPILKPETEAERGLIAYPNADVEAGMALPAAAPFHGGVWYDPGDGLLKMWYKAGFFGTVALASSKDGIHWERPVLDVVPGTNQLLPIRPDWQQDSNAVIFDPDTQDAARRYKMFIYNNAASCGNAFTSPDGIHWSNPVQTGTTGDCTTIFYNPFRKKWVYSIRDYWHRRSRKYSECDDFIEGARFTAPVRWLRTDRLDPADPEIGAKPELYNFNAVAYESIMLGTFNIYEGIRKDAEAGDIKYNDIHLGYSRDGFHYYRPEDRTPFLCASRKAGDWERGYLHDCASICIVNGDELWFYYAGFCGNGRQGWFDMHSYASTGLAVLRRDGFASMNAGAAVKTLTTRPLLFDGSYLFVNVDAPSGALRAEVLDRAGKVIEGYGMEDCSVVSADSTRKMLTWHGRADLSFLAGTPVRFRFALENGKLYSFWVSRDKTGSSNGYLAGGALGQPGLVDSPTSDQA